MHVKIDWYSFSVLIGEKEGRGLHETVEAIRDELTDIDFNLADMLGVYDDVEKLAGRKPYSHQYLFLSTGVRLLLHPNLPHAVFEITGAACDKLHDTGMLHRIIGATQSRCTRLDIAVDIETEVRPLEFAEMRDLGRFKSFSIVESESGSTYYVGSKTSERYARVYRYNEPHERAHLLRCEMVLRGKQAQVVIPEMLVSGVDLIAAQLGNNFGWKHELWQTCDLTTDKAASYRPERREGKTLFWLVDTIAPLLRRLHKAGTIDVFSWFEEHVQKRIEDNDVDF